MGGDGGARREAQRAREAEEARERRVKGGTAQIRDVFARQFDDKYYEDMAAAGKKALQPQLENQFDAARKQLQFALARTGNLNSTTRDRREGILTERNLLGQSQMEDQIRQAQQGRRQDVANAEGMAVGQLQSSADPVAAAAQAAGLARANSEMPQFQPLGQVFTDVTAGLATQAELERDNRARYDYGVSRWMPGSRNRYTQNVNTGR